MYQPIASAYFRYVAASSILFIITRPVGKPSLGFETFFLNFFFCCRNHVIIDFLGNLRRAIKLVLNSPTCFSTVVSAGLVRMRFENKL